MFKLSNCCTSKVDVRISGTSIRSVLLLLKVCVSFALILAGCGKSAAPAVSLPLERVLDLGVCNPTLGSFSAGDNFSSRARESLDLRFSVEDSEIVDETPLQIKILQRIRGKDVTCAFGICREAEPKHEGAYASVLLAPKEPGMYSLALISNGDTLCRARFKVSK